MATINNVMLGVSLLLLVVSYFNRNNLLDDMGVDSELTAEPIQIEQDEAVLDLEVDEFQYEVIPHHEYEITGLVVSYRLHSGKHGVHRLTKDRLNVADICIVWGENATALPLTDFEFWNREFTCYVQTKSNAAWEQFNGHELSNNHLITHDPEVRRAIRKVGIGDQIRIKGWLADYRNVAGSGYRESSVTRDDTGNGACETILVSEMTIIDSYTNNWRVLMYLSLVVVLFCIVWFVRRPFRVANA